MRQRIVSVWILSLCFAVQAWCGTYPDTTFLVMSDLHFYDTTLGTEGQAFRDYLARDRKLLTQSGEILDTAIDRMTAENAEFILVSGDLTKDGEALCHREVARRLHRLLDTGKKIIVVPGNHDILNPESERYSGDASEPEPSIIPADFSTIYSDFGYRDALFRDSRSLSYVAEPVEGLWVMALDSNRYRDNRTGHPAIVGGTFSKDTLTWLEKRLADARNRKKAVIAVLHHGIMEHYPANEKFYARYLVDDREKVARLLAAYGVCLVFTGHFHAQDVTLKDVALPDGRTQRIFDIETGSLVTAPCPYRRVEIREDRASITSTFITAIPSMGDTFKTHAADAIFDGTVRLADAKLAKFKVSEPEQHKIDRQVAGAYVAHLKGDEVKPATVIDTTGFGLWLRLVAWYQKDLLEGWYTDLPPRDNNLTIDLATGRVAE